MRRHLNTQLLLISILLLFAAQQGLAETVNLTSVRTGEHDNFTRIVFEFTKTVQFNKPEIIGKGKFSVSFAESSTDLPPSTVYETDRLQKVQSIEVSKDNSNLTATVTLTFPYFKLKAFSLSNPDRIVVDAYRVSVLSKGSVQNTSLKDDASSEESKTLEKKEDVNPQVSSPTKETSRQSAESLNVQKPAYKRSGTPAEEKSTIQNSTFSDYFFSGGGERKLIPSIGLREGFNDNLFFDTSNEIDDTITTIFGGLEVLNRTERLDLDLSARLDGVMYADNDELNDVDQFYNGRIGYKITERVRIGAGGGFSEDSRPDRDIETSGIVLTGVKRKRWTGDVSGDVTLSEKSVASMSYAYQQDKFDKPKFVDYEFHTVNLGFTHDFSDVLPRVIGRINAEYNYYNTDDTDIENVYATVGFSRDISEIFNLLIDAGYRYAASEFKVATIIPTPPFLITTTTDTEYDSGFNGRIVLGYAGETTRADISASQRLEPASGRNGTAERTSFVFNVRKRFAEKFSASLYATYYLNKADIGKLAREAIDEETVSIRPGLSYEIIDNLVLTASYTYTRVKYKLGETEAKRNSVYIQLSYGIPLFE